MSFLNMTGLSRQMKTAWRADRLRIGHLVKTGNGPEYADKYLCVGTMNCMFLVTEERTPNKMRALITEYLGDVPDGMKVTDYGKTGQARELEESEEEILNNVAFPSKQLSQFTLTPIIVHESNIPVRLIQNKKTGECIGVKQEYLDIITKRDIQYEYEGDPIGPEVDESIGFCYFTNSNTTFIMAIYRFSTDLSQEIVSTLRMIELEEKQQ